MSFTCVPDTNVLISAFIRPRSVPARAILHVLETGKLVVSERNLLEFRETLLRPRFDRYVHPRMRAILLARLEPRLKIIQINEQVRASRDPKDDHILETAVAASAEIVITGDNDLLVLDPFRGIRILKPGRYLALYAPTS